MAVAVLLDVMSIQDYIFKSNRLKENLGASYIVEHLYDDEEIETLVESGKGYMGGGNAFFILDSKNDAEKIMKDFTKKLLVNYPGVTVACALEENFNVNSGFRDSMKKLFQKLQENKNRAVPLTHIMPHGITAECPETGLSMEHYQYSEDDSGYISSVSASKLNCTKKAVNSAYSYLKELNLYEKYVFTNEIDKLGQSRDEDSHIAVVHIDGNDMGERFKKCSSLEEIKILSDRVQSAVRESFKYIILKIESEFDNLKKELSLENDEKNRHLPVRPIILGGDDVTFVCDGRLGIYFASLFIKKFEEQKVPDGEPLTACAGVSIVKTKYPFFRAYRLAEDLCRNAKKKRKEEIKKGNSDGSWLDFHASFGGISGTIETIRKKYYINSEGNSVLMRPYRLSDLESMLGGIKKIKLLPRSKIKDLHNALTMNESRWKNVKKQLNFRDHEFPSTIFNTDYSTDFFVNGKTPYYDMIEMIELLPEYVVEEGGF